ncbi:unnamed protein product [Rotaria socialis]|uniref:Uncharacterized protein n=3 Tax=Rotaria socialis TaxID=392032 RepID=A0A817V1P4_9BILA|nr:unnamed protein product [Rotaria socialis]CAF3387841.1 unnamed protein product [Rotaria socialis]CAF3517222.1 unnamed protein product [Rotaria socialis]CAF4290656.1 unnamed protein product [Rotaria socialis]CAF4473135.1 unnamed protein product [Rotaria socialis]
MLTHSPRDRSRSPHSSDGTSSVKQTHQSNQNDSSSQIESTDNSKDKKENDSQQHMKNLKSFIQTLLNESTSTIDSTYDEQMKILESACIEEYRDLSTDRIRRMIRSALKLRKTQPSSSNATSHTTTSPFLHKDHTKTLSTTNERFNSTENTSKKSRPSSVSNNSTTKTADLASSSPSALSALDADFLRHAFSQQFRPSLDLSAYFSDAFVAPSNGTSAPSSLFCPNFSPSTFLQSLTNTTSLTPSIPLPPPPPTFISSHAHTNGTSDSSPVKSSKQMKLSSTEATSIKVLVNAYREAASYLTRSADELEQLM